MGGKSSPPPPDYTPLADASAETAKVSAELGKAQLDESKRQYDREMEVTQPVIDAQLKVMQQGIDQGDDYYNYMKEKQRPVEDALQANALQDTTARDAAERASITDAQTGLAKTVGDVGAKQAAFGNQYADSLASQYGGVTDKLRADSTSAMDRFGNASDAALSKFGNVSDAELATLRSTVGDATGKLDSSLSASDQAMKDAAASVAGAGDKIAANSAQREGQINQDIGLYTAGNGAIRDKYGADIENDAALAMADSRAGSAQATNQAMRQAMRYGIDVGDLAKQASLRAGQAEAAAANSTRTASTDTYRGLVGQGIGMRQTLMNSGNAADVAAAQANLGGANLAVNAAGTSASNALGRAGYVTNAAGDLASRGTNAAQTIAAGNIDTARSMATAGIDLANRGATMDAGTIDATMAARKAASDQGFASQLQAANLAATVPSMSRDLRVTDDATARAK